MLRTRTGNRLRTSAAPGPKRKTTGRGGNNIRSCRDRGVEVGLAVAVGGSVGEGCRPAVGDHVRVGLRVGSVVTDPLTCGVGVGLAVGTTLGVSVAVNVAAGTARVAVALYRAVGVDVALGRAVGVGVALGGDAHGGSGSGGQPRDASQGTHHAAGAQSSCWQCAEQPSHDAWFPSSHSSG